MVEDEGMNSTLYYVRRFLTHPRLWKEINLVDYIVTRFKRRVPISEFVNNLTNMQHQPDEVCELGFNNKLREKPVLFALVRALKPSIVIETGVGGGYSSAYILEGIRQNGFGCLYSIDKAETYNAAYYGYPKDFPLGGVVPEHLRNNWTISDGGSENDLLPMLERLGQIDLFIHDSLHTREIMEFECETAWKYLREGGLLISHDVWKPWFDFCKGVHRKPALYDVYGGIRKWHEQ